MPPSAVPQQVPTCFLLPPAGTVPAAFLAGSRMSSQSGILKVLRIQSTWQQGKRSRPFGKAKGEEGTQAVIQSLR